MARLKENDAVLVANRRDRPSDRLECERRVPLRGRVAPVVSLRGGSRLASRKLRGAERGMRAHRMPGEWGYTSGGATCASAPASLRADSLGAGALCSANPLGRDSSPMPPLSALSSLALEL